MDRALIAIELQDQDTRSFSMGRVNLDDGASEYAGHYLSRGYPVFGHFIVTMVGDSHLAITNQSADTLERRTHSGILTCGLVIRQGRLRDRAASR